MMAKEATTVTGTAKAGIASGSRPPIEVDRVTKCGSSAFLRPSAVNARLST